MRMQKYTSSGIFLIIIISGIPDKVYICLHILIYTCSGVVMQSTLSQFVKQRRKQTGLTQEELAYKAGVGLRFIRDLEQGKATLRLDKVNQVLRLFNHEAGPVPMPPASDKLTTNYVS